MKVLGLFSLVALFPLWIVLYLISWFGIVANGIFSVLYEPVYKLAGKPFDK